MAARRNASVKGILVFGSPGSVLVANRYSSAIPDGLFIVASVHVSRINVELVVPQSIAN